MNYQPTLFWLSESGAIGSRTDSTHNQVMRPNDRMTYCVRYQRITLSLRVLQIRDRDSPHAFHGRRPHDLAPSVACHALS